MDLESPVSSSSLKTEYDTLVDQRCASHRLRQVASVLWQIIHQEDPHDKRLTILSRTATCCGGLLNVTVQHTFTSKLWTWELKDVSIEESEGNLISISAEDLLQETRDLEDMASMPTPDEA